MKSPRMTTLFSEPPPLARGPSGFVISFLVHGVVFGFVVFGMLHPRHIRARYNGDRFTLRVLNLNDTQAQLRRAAGSGIMYRAPHSGSHASGGAHSSGTSGGSPPTPPAVPRQSAKLIPAPQTLVQPDLPPNIILPDKMPVPLIMLWTPEVTVVKRVVPPPPHPPTATEVKPSLEPPNNEEKIADLKIASTPFTTAKAAPLPSTTSPVVSHAPDPVQKVPEMTTQSTVPPTPAKVISLSDLRMSQGTIALPKANEISSTASVGPLSPGQSKTSPPVASVNPTSKDVGTGGGAGGGEHAGQSAVSTPKPGDIAAAGQTGNGDHPGKDDAAGSGPANSDDKTPGGKSGTSNGAAVQGNSNSSGAGAKGASSGAVASSGSGGTGNASNSGAASGFGSLSDSSVEHISLPKDGQFGVVVVGGASLEAKYPETADVWSGRLASSVYLHLGKKKSWILQYSLPRDADVSIVGSGGHLDAPWPFEIVKPKIDTSDLDVDAVIVHGFVNKAGRFEGLALAFPADFPQQKLVLAAIQQWQFRPASQNGQNVPVEVLLIIPAEQD
jgi:hypothetical protein